MAGPRCMEAVREARRPLEECFVDICKSGPLGRETEIFFKVHGWIKVVSAFWEKIKFLRFAQSQRSEVLLSACPFEGMGLFDREAFQQPAVLLPGEGTHF